MKSKESKINIDVNIYGTRFSMAIPFSEQDAVRATETQMKARFKILRERYSMRTPLECMAMLAYEYASGLYAMKAQLEADTAEAEDLLLDAERLCGEERQTDTSFGLSDFGGD